MRGVQSLGAPVERAAATARVALNLRGVAVEELSRGDALLTPGAFRSTDLVDVTLDRRPGGPAARRAGGARRLGDRRARGCARWAAPCVRLRLAAPLPLRVGDRLLLRDPGARRVLGADVRDVDPPELRRRGAARQRAAELAARPGARARPPTSPGAGWCGPTTSPRWAGRCRPDADRRGPVAAGRRAGRRAGRAGCPRWSPRTGSAQPLEPGPPVDVVRRALELPDAELVAAVVRPPLALRDGRVVEAAAALPAAVQAAVDGVPRPAGRRPVRRPRGARPGRRRARPAGAGRRGAQRSAGAHRRGGLPRARASSGGPGRGWPGCRSRSRSARPARRGAPAAGSPSR